jgi:NADPH2:quinone reductase
MTTTREIPSEITSSGRLKLSLEDADIGEPGPGDVVVRIEASPINPADLWLLLGPATWRS